MNRKTITSIIKWTGIVIIGLAVIYAILLIGSTIRLHQAYAALARDGRPMRAEDIIPPWVPDMENAALSYQIAILRLRAEPAGPKNLLEHLSDLTWRDPNDREELERWFQEKAVIEALAAVEQGAQRSRCRFDIWDSSPIVGHTLQGMGRLAGLLNNKARFEADRGHIEGAWGTVETCLRLTQATKRVPVLDFQGMRMGSIRGVTRVIQDLCEIALPDPSQTAVIEPLLRDLVDDRDLLAALDGERLFVGEWVFSLPRTELQRQLRRIFPDKSWIDLARISIGMSFKPLLQNDHAHYLRVLYTFSRIAQTPYAGLDQDLAIQAVPRRVLGRFSFVTGQIMPYTFDFDRQFHTLTIAAVRITRAGLAVLQHKQTHGVFPEDLSTLGLQDLDDPFSGRPLIYRSEGAGFIVYSIGFDQKDDGGIPQPRHAWREPGCDVVWRYPGPKAL